METLIVLFRPKPEQSDALVDRLTRDFPQAGQEMPGVLANRLYQSEDGNHVINIAHFESAEACEQARNGLEHHLDRVRDLIEDATPIASHAVFSTPNYNEVTAQQKPVRNVTADTRELENA